MIKKNTMQAKNCLNSPTDYGVSFSRGVRVDLPGHSILYISGTASVDEKGKTFKPYDFKAQAERTFFNISKLLETEEATWKDIVFTRIYLKNMDFYSKFNRFRNNFYKKNKIKQFPASVCVEARLCRDDLLIEIEAQAILEKKANG